MKAFWTDIGLPLLFMLGAGVAVWQWQGNGWAGLATFLSLAAVTMR